MLLSGGRTDIPQEIIIASLCVELSMGYNELMEQPDWLIQTILTRKKVEGEIANKQQKSHGNNN